MIGLSIGLSFPKFRISSLPQVELITPTSLQATATNLASSLSWSGGEGNSFSIYRNVINSHTSETNIANDLSETLYEDADIIPGVRYYYWVKASVGGLFSSYSSASNCIPYVEISQGSYAELVTPSGSWALGTLFYSLSPTPAEALVRFAEIDYLYDGLNWKNGNNNADNVVINGSFAAYAPQTNGDWRFWDTVAP